MKYFNHVETLDELKSEYRRLALENHPDRGGKVEIVIPRRELVQGELFDDLEDIV